MTDIVNTIAQQQFEKRDMLNNLGIERSGTPLLKEQLKSKLVKSIIGPRRAGKSTFALQALKGHPFGYLNFEDDALPNPLVGDELFSVLNDLVPDARYFLFDEIQHLSRWEMWINKLHRRGHNIIITGSNSTLLSGELASSITGRHLLTTLLPFSFREYLLTQETTRTSESSSSTVLDWFRKFIKASAFPEVVTSGVSEEAYLRTLLNSIVLKDIVKRHKLRKIEAIERVVTLLLASVSRPFSARSIERAAPGVSIATIQKYINYARDAFLLFDLQQYHFKPKLRLVSDRKIYVSDIGFVGAKLPQLISSEDIALENFVFLELVRRGARPNLDLFFYKTSAGYEVDFVVLKSDLSKLLIQVCLNLQSISTRERELRALAMAADELHAQELLILTMNEKGIERAEGRTIKIEPCYSWALAE